jgi:hypothetical protein
MEATGAGFTPAQWARLRGSLAKQHTFSPSSKKTTLSPGKSAISASSQKAAEPPVPPLDAGPTWAVTMSTMLMQSACTLATPPRAASSLPQAKTLSVEVVGGVSPARMAVASLERSVMSARSSTSPAWSPGAQLKPQTHGPQTAGPAPVSPGKPEGLPYRLRLTAVDAGPGTGEGRAGAQPLPASPGAPSRGALASFRLRPAAHSEFLSYPPPVFRTVAPVVDRVGREGDEEEEEEGSMDAAAFRAVDDAMSPELRATFAAPPGARPSSLRLSEPAASPVNGKSSVQSAWANGFSREGRLPHSSLSPVLGADHARLPLFRPGSGTEQGGSPEDGSRGGRSRSLSNQPPLFAPLDDATVRLALVGYTSNSPGWGRREAVEAEGGRASAPEHNLLERLERLERLEALRITTQEVVAAAVVPPRTASSVRAAVGHAPGPSHEGGSSFTAMPPEGGPGSWVSGRPLPPD